MGGDLGTVVGPAENHRSLSHVKVKFDTGMRTNIRVEYIKPVNGTTKAQPVPPGSVAEVEQRLRTTAQRLSRAQGTVKQSGSSGTRTGTSCFGGCNVTCPTNCHFLDGCDLDCG